MPQFPTIDITHKPLRTQSGNVQNNIRAGGSSFPSTEAATTDTPTRIQPTNFRMSLESAITYYEQEAAVDSQRGILFKATAGWLRENLMLRNTVKELRARIDQMEEAPKGDAEIESLVAAEIAAETVNLAK